MAAASFAITVVKRLLKEVPEHSRPLWYGQGQQRAGDGSHAQMSLGKLLYALQHPVVLLSDRGRHGSLVLTQGEPLYHKSA
jgi:hypothetical protein